MTAEANAENMTPEQRRERARLEKLAARVAAESPRKTYKPSDFLFDASLERYWCVPNASIHNPVSVNALIPMEFWRMPMAEGRGRPPAPVKPSLDIARIENNTVVESSTWLPGSPRIIQDMIVSAEGFFPVTGARAFNTYRAPPAPNVELADRAGPWVAHVKKLWPEPEEHNYFFDYCAHMVQRPEEKCNAAILVSGKQGIGKDAALLPLRDAVGSWNTRNVTPDELLERFNPWVETLMLTVDEVRPTSDDHRATGMYDALKTLITTPPNTLALEQKLMPVRYVANVMRIFLTTNDRLAMYIPPEDRRLMVLHSELPQNWHLAADDVGYFDKLFAWLHTGGAGAVAGWLAARDISQFQPKGQVPKTGTWAEIAQRWDAPEDELTQALDMLGEPDCVLGSELSEQLFDGVEVLRKMMRGRGFVFRMQQAGYKAVALPPGKAHWLQFHEGYRVKTSKAYVKEALGMTIAEARNLVQERLSLRAKAGAAGAVPRAREHVVAIK